MDATNTEPPADKAGPCPVATALELGHTARQRGTLSSSAFIRRRRAYLAALVDGCTCTGQDHGPPGTWTKAQLATAVDRDPAVITRTTAPEVNPNAEDPADEHR